MALSRSLTEAEEHERQVALMRWLSAQTRRLGVAEHTYVVGGAVRNWVIGQPIKDIDVMIDSIAAKRDSEWLAKQLAKAIPAKTGLTTNQYGVAILTVAGPWKLGEYNLQGEVIEIANARRESYGGVTGKGYKPSDVEPASAKDDVVRREFTLNTLMWKLAGLASGPDKAEIVDLTGCGLRDLKAGVLACPVDPDKTFGDDPTRMLRAVKFIVKYGFTLRGAEEQSIRRNALKLRNAPGNAIAVILTDAVLKEPATAKKALQEMKRLGLLDVVADMIRSDRAFAAQMQRWAANRKLALLFDMLDMGLPLGEPLKFLTKPQIDRLRAVVVGMQPGEPERFVADLKQPGRALGDKTFFARVAAERGAVTGKDVGNLSRRLSELAREALLQNPELWQDSRRLQAAVVALL